MTTLVSANRDLINHSFDLIDKLYNNGTYMSGRTELFLPRLQIEEINVIKHMAISTGFIEPIIRHDIDDFAGEPASDHGEIMLSFIGLLRMRQYKSFRAYRNSPWQITKRLLVTLFGRSFFFTLTVLEKSEKTLIPLNTLVTIFSAVVTTTILILTTTQNNTIARITKENTYLQHQVDSLTQQKKSTTLERKYKPKEQTSTTHP